MSEETNPIVLCLDCRKPLPPRPRGQPGAARLRCPDCAKAAIDRNQRERFQAIKADPVAYAERKAGIARYKREQRAARAAARAAQNNSEQS